MPFPILRTLLFSGFAFILLGLLYFFPDQALPLAYLLIIPIVGITQLNSLKVGSLFTFLCLTAALILLGQAQQPLGIFFLISLSVSISAWLSAAYYQRQLAASQSLTAEWQQNKVEIENQNKKLRLTAEIGQVASASLELSPLMNRTIDLIHRQFGFYHVAIYLVDETGRKAYLSQSSGKAGDLLKTENFSILVGSKSLIGSTLASGEPQIVADVSKSELFLEHPLLPKTRSEMVLPLKARGEVLGALDVQNEEVAAFNTEDIAIMQLLANQIGSSIDNARLFNALQDRLNETEAVFNMISFLSQTLNKDELFQRAAEVFYDQLNIASCVIMTGAENENVLLIAGSYPAGLNHDPARFPLDQFPSLRQVFHSGRTAVHAVMHAVMHAVTDPALTTKEKQQMEQVGAALALDIPLYSGNQTLGIIRLYRQEHSPFLPSEIKIAVAMADQVAVAIKNTQLAVETQSRAAELNMLNRVSRILSVSDKLSDVFNGARREIFALTRATGISIMLLTEDGEHLEWAYGYEYGAEVAIPQRILPISQGLSGYVVRMREPLLITERFEEEIERHQSVIVGTVAAAWLGVPLIVGNQIIGVLVIENGDDAAAFSDRDTQLLTTISGPLAITIENQRLLQEARERAYRQQLLNEISTQLHRSADVDTILGIGLRALSAQLPGRDVQLIIDHDYQNGD